MWNQFFKDVHDLRIKFTVASYLQPSNEIRKFIVMLQHIRYEYGVDISDTFIEDVLDHNISGP